MFPSPDKWEPGIYFGLPANDYHKLPWIGSSSMKTLYSSPPDYWFESAMNPLRDVEDESFALKFGTALHDRILYGEEYFRQHYTPIEGGNKDGSIEAERLKKWIADQGGNPSKLKADNERMVAEQFNTTLVAQKVFDKIIISAQMITKNPNLAQAFINGVPEVSIFWDEGGVPCKCRLDYLKMGGIADLKSFRSKERISTLDKWVLQDLFNYRYDIQQAHYFNGHVAAGALLQQGKVFTAPGALRPDNDWLARAFKSPPNWTFVFYKADGMPIAKSYQIAPGSPAHESGKAAVRLGLDNYRDNMAKFGTDAWVNMDEPFQIDETDMPKWL
jgi:hypothetical protein